MAAFGGPDVLEVQSIAVNLGVDRASRSLWMHIQSDSPYLVSSSKPQQPISSSHPDRSRFGDPDGGGYELAVDRKSFRVQGVHISSRKFVLFGGPEDLLQHI